jgi:hypothetical protein
MTVAAGPVMRLGVLAVVLVCACAAQPVAAPSRPRDVRAAPALAPAPAPAPRRPPSIPIDFDAPLPAFITADDIAFVAEVSAAEITFDTQPGRVDVQLHAPGTGKKLFTAIRHNLPNPVAPHTTYRNVRVRVVIASSLPSAEELLRALDVIPLPPPSVDSRPPGDATP